MRRRAPTTVIAEKKAGRPKSSLKCDVIGQDMVVTTSCDLSVARDVPYTVYYNFQIRRQLTEGYRIAWMRNGMCEDVRKSTLQCTTDKREKFKG